MVGKNTVNSDALAGFIDEIEQVRARKKECTEAESAIMANAKAAGFQPGGIRTVLKLRAMKPFDRQEAEAIRDQYLHALGMDTETPLFRTVGLMAVDRISRDSVVEGLKAWVPENGSIVIDAGGRPVKLTRDRDGVVSVAEVSALTLEPTEPRASVMAAPLGPPRAVPEVDAAGALELGREAFRANTPVIANPFPFGDQRRPRWDEGWRRESGTDGMGPGA